MIARASLVLFALVLVACTVDSDPVGARCESNADCSAGVCVRPDGLSESERGFCLNPMDAGSVEAGTDACVATFPDDCTPGDQDCDGAFDEDVDLTTAANCGSCGRACEGATPVCDSLDGTPDCSTGCGGLRCGDSCVDTSTNPSHCGACDFACDPGESCVGGECRCGSVDCSAGAMPACCAGSCVDLFASNDHCGTCNSGCASGVDCGGGLCPCGGTIDCRSTCLANVCTDG